MNVFDLETSLPNTRLTLLIDKPLILLVTSDLVSYNSDTPRLISCLAILIADSICLVVE